MQIILRILVVCLYVDLLCACVCVRVRVRVRVVLLLGLMVDGHAVLWLQ